MNAQPPEPHTPSPPLPWLTPLGLWNICWLILPVLILGLWLHAKLTTEIVVEEWPNGYSSNGDHWCSGVFLGRTADRIRRTATYHGDRVDRHTIHFFASVPMDQLEFERELGKWQASPDFRKSTGNPIPFPQSLYRPDWFPTPVPEIHVGTILDGGWTFELFRVPGDNHIYLK